MPKVTFTPLAADLPALRAAPNPGGGNDFVFQAIDVNGVIEIETYHASFADALQQVAQRMNLVWPLSRRPEYRVSEE